MSPPAQSFPPFTGPGGAGPGLVNQGDVATWAPSTLTLTDTVISGGQFLASHAGQAFAFLTTPLQGWASGLPS